MAIWLRAINMPEWGIPENSPTYIPFLNYKRLAVDRLWVYKFENRFLGSPYQPSSATNSPKQNSDFFFGTGYSTYWSNVSQGDDLRSLKLQDEKKVFPLDCQCSPTFCLHIFSHLHSSRPASLSTQPSYVRSALPLHNLAQS